MLLPKAIELMDLVTDEAMAAVDACVMIVAAGNSPDANEETKTTMREAAEEIIHLATQIKRGAEDHPTK